MTNDDKPFFVRRFKKGDRFVDDLGHTGTVVSDDWHLFIDVYSVIFDHGEGLICKAVDGYMDHLVSDGVV